MAHTAESPAPRRRGRRPSAQVRAEVLAATATVMFGEGVRAVTFDRVATRSGASKTTLYKWWPSPGAMAAEAYFTTSAAELEFHDTGDLDTDIRAQLRAFVRLLTQSPHGRVIAELIGAAQTDADLAAALSAHYTRPRRRLAVEYFTLAQERGQLRPDVDPVLLVDQLWGACYNRLLVPDAPLDDGVADALVTNTLIGAATPGYRGRTAGQAAPPLA